MYVIEFEIVACRATEATHIPRIVQYCVGGSETEIELDVGRKRIVGRVR